jgi:hypothetical protein
MSILIYTLASVLVAVATISSAQQLVILTRRSDKQRPPVPVWRAAVSRAGQRLRLSVVALLFGVHFLISGARSSTGDWLVVSIMVAIFVWDRGVWLLSVRRTRSHASR